MRKEWKISDFQPVTFLNDLFFITFSGPAFTVFSCLMCLIYDCSFHINQQWKIIRWSLNQTTFFCLLMWLNVVNEHATRVKTRDVKKQGEERKINLLFSLFDVLIRSAIVIIKWMNKLSDAGIKSNKAITMVNIRLKHPLENKWFVWNIFQVHYSSWVWLNAEELMQLIWSRGWQQ